METASTEHHAGQLSELTNCSNKLKLDILTQDFGFVYGDRLITSFQGSNKNTELIPESPSNKQHSHLRCDICTLTHRRQLFQHQGSS